MKVGRVTKKRTAIKTEPPHLNRSTVIFSKSSALSGQQRNDTCKGAPEIRNSSNPNSHLETRGDRKYGVVIYQARRDAYPNN